MTHFSLGFKIVDTLEINRLIKYFKARNALYFRAVFLKCLDMI